MTYANDRTATDLEYAEALDIMARQRMAQVILDHLDYELANEVPAPAEDEQVTNEGGGKAVPARPTLTGCDWLRSEGVLDELPN